jgi:hypothetical protein
MKVAKRLGPIGAGLSFVVEGGVILKKNSDHKKLEKAKEDISAFVQEHFKCMSEALMEGSEAMKQFSEPLSMYEEVLQTEQEKLSHYQMLQKNLVEIQQELEQFRREVTIAV